MLDWIARYERGFLTTTDAVVLLSLGSSDFCVWVSKRLQGATNKASILPFTQRQSDSTNNMSATHPGYMSQKIAAPPGPVVAAFTDDGSMTKDKAQPRPRASDQINVAIA